MAGIYIYFARASNEISLLYVKLESHRFAIYTRRKLINWTTANIYPCVKISPETGKNISVSSKSV